MKKIVLSVALIVVIALAGCSGAQRETRYIPPSKQIAPDSEKARYIPPSSPDPNKWIPPAVDQGGVELAKWIPPAP